MIPASAEKQSLKFSIK